MTTATASPRHARRLVTRVAGVAAISVLLAGCSTGAEDVGGDFSAERSVVESFLSALEQGDATGASAYIADDSVLTDGALSNDFYARAAARPEQSSVTLATESGGQVYVTATYTLDGDAREMYLVMDEADEPRIESWSGVTLKIETSGAGRLTVSDDLTVDLDAGATALSLLPGAYDLAYLGSALNGGAGPFTLDFPVVADDVAGSLPEGMTYTGGVLTIGAGG